MKKASVILCVGVVCLTPACPKDAPSAAQTSVPAAKGSTTVPALHGAIATLKDTDVVASVKGQPIYAREVMEKLHAAEIRAESEFLTKVGEARDGIVRQHVMEKLLTEAATKAGHKTLEDYLKAEAEKVDSVPDDATLRTLYARLVPGGEPPFEQVKFQLIQAQVGRARQQAVADIMARVEKENQVEWKMPAPVLPRLDISADDDPVLGDADAPVTIVEFSDFECPYCARVAVTVHDLVEHNKGKVRVVFRDFPLSFHKQAKVAAHAANCANAQGRFWQFHDQVFKNQETEGGLSEKALKTYARVAGTDGEKFDACLADPSLYAKELEKDMADGESYGVQGTPTFFINGRLFSGEPTADGFQGAIDAALAEAG